MAILILMLHTLAVLIVEINVAEAAISKPYLWHRNWKKVNIPGKAFMMPSKSENRKEILEFVQKHIKEGAILHSDKSKDSLY